MTVIVDNKRYTEAEFSALVSLPNATHVDAIGCTSLTSLPNLPNATHVYASGCTALTSLPDLPNARDVYASGCTALTSLPNLPNARDVDASGCTALTSLPDLPNATHVYARGCTALTSFRGHALPDAATARARLADVAKAALATPDALNMCAWHTCDTTHCMAGWAITLAGDKGRKLEAKYGPHAAGTILLGVKASGWFYLSNDDAREKLQAVLEGNAP